MNDFAVHPGAKSADSYVSCGVFEDVVWLDWSTCSYNEDIAVFRFHCADDITDEPNWSLLLHPDEIQRAGRYRRQEDRYRSLYTRSLLRMLAGKYTNQSPTTLRVITGVNQKPVLQDNPDCHINAAHSGNWIMLAISKVSVGVDIEKIVPDFSFPDVIAHSFSAPERQYIEADANPSLRFYQLWTRKEALVKATAKGIDNDFSQIPALIGVHRIAAHRLGASGSWTVSGFTAADDYIGAVAHQLIAESPRFYSIDRSCFFV